MSLLGQCVNLQPIIAKITMMGLLCTLLASCQTLAPHPLPVKFDSQTNNQAPTKPTNHNHKNNPKQAQEKDKPKLFYLFENWFN